MSLNGERLEEVNSFKYLVSQIERGRGVEEDVNFRVGEVTNVVGAIKKLWRNEGMRTEAV